VTGMVGVRRREQRSLRDEHDHPLPDQGKARRSSGARCSRGETRRAGSGFTVVMEAHAAPAPPACDRAITLVRGGWRAYRTFGETERVEDVPWADAGRQVPNNGAWRVAQRVRSDE
jgi:hypothetical protein